MKVRVSNWQALVGGLALAASSAILPASTAQAQVFAAPQLINSFETAADLDANHLVPQADPILIGTPAQSTSGVTHLTKSLDMQLAGGGSQFGSDSLSGWGVQLNSDATNSPAAYAGWALAAANPDYWEVRVDVTTLPNAWAGTDFEDGGTQWSFPRLGLSYDGGFGQVQLGQNLYNTVGKNTLSVPLSNLVQTGVPLPTNSSFYGLLVGANQRFQSPTPTTGVHYYVDNVRLHTRPITGGVTLFSWETPDNPATPNVNEALEGWSDAGLNQGSATSLGDRFAHTDSVTNYNVRNVANTANTFPTAGTHSLKIDTTSQDPAYVAPGNTTGLSQSYGFRWGTNLVLDSTIDADDTTQTAEEAANAAKISNLAAKINSASAIAFDVSFSDPIADAQTAGLGVFQGGSTSGIPGFLSIAMHISDGRGTFFQYDSPALDGAAMNALVLEQNNDGNSPEEPLTFVFPTSGLIDKGATLLGSLANAPIPTTTDFLRIGLALNFNNGPVIAHIDNFRVLTETAPLDADFNRHGQVNGTDLGVWKTAFGAAANSNGDANEDGYSDGKDLLIWQRQLGSTASGATPPFAAVPEPASLVLVGLGVLAAGTRRRS